jgi:hypothetical protein
VEDALDAKTAELIALRRAAMQHSAVGLYKLSPVDP